jgi:hypothetical protein
VELLGGSVDGVNTGEGLATAKLRKVLAGCIAQGTADPWHARIWIGADEGDRTDPPLWCLTIRVWGYIHHNTAHNAFVGINRDEDILFVGREDHAIKEGKSSVDDMAQGRCIISPHWANCDGTGLTSGLGGDRMRFGHRSSLRWWA